MINFYSQLHLPKIGIRDYNLSQHTGLNHLDKGLHLLEVRMQRIRNYVVYFIRRLMVQHQKVSINADEMLSKGTFLCFFYDLSPVFLADQMNKSLGFTGSQKIGSKLC